MSKLVKNNYPIYLALILFGFVTGVFFNSNYSNLKKNNLDLVSAQGVGETDVTPPEVKILFPTAKSRISPNTNLTISASANDNFGVKLVNFYVSEVIRAPSNSTDGFFQIPGRKEYLKQIHQCVDIEQPFNCDWFVPSTRNSTYLIQVVAYDSSDNKGISKYIEFAVR